MTNQFLPYLETYKENTQNNPDAFTQSARSKICVTLQKYYGMQITGRSTVDAVTALLQNGCIFILTERFLRDPIEEYAGIQRQLRRRNDNPGMAKFGYNDNAVRIQRYVSFIPGNMKGKDSKRNSRIEVSAETVPKRKSWT